MQSYSDLNSIVIKNLTKKPKSVIIVLDAFGWNLFDKLKEKSSFIYKYINFAEPLESVFPSATGAAIAAFNLNCKPSEHGVIDAKQYLPEIDQNIWTFNRQNFITSKDLNSDDNAKVFFKHKTFWQELEDLGYASTLFLHKNLLKSIYNQEINLGAKTVPFININEGLTLLKNKVLENNGVFYIYWDDIDVVSHEYGWNSEEVESIALATLVAVEHFVSQIDLSSTSILIFSDHGQTVVQPKNQIVLDEIIPDFFDYLSKTKNGDLVLPSGSSREVFIKVQDGKKNELIKLLNARLDKFADVYDINTSFVSDWFPGSSDGFIKRLGDIAIFPKDDMGVWYTWNGKSKTRPGAHGGISKAERQALLININ